MIAALRYGIGREVIVPVSDDSVARLSKNSVQEAIQAFMSEVAEDPEGTAPVIRDAVADPRSVIEVKSGGGYRPLEHRAPIKPVIQGRRSVEILVSRPHAGG